VGIAARLAPWLLACAPALAADVVDLASPRIDELSGLAVSRADPTVLWGHNDTGAGPVLYRIGPDGADLGAVMLRDARAADWEDIASFDHRGQPALLIADVGDNFAIRGLSTLYAVSDPGRSGEPALLWRLDFRYPDGSRDCEAVAVDSVNREILLVSKRDVPPRLYRLPLPERTPGAPLTAEYLGEIPDLPRVTLGERAAAPLKSRYVHAPVGLDISRDGTAAVLLTARHAYLYRRLPGGSWLEAFAGPATVLPLPDITRVEAVAFAADGRALFVGAEGRPGRLAFLPIPQALSGPPQRSTPAPRP
jgi:dipeptidyl aminopeptidase/acylaminoacyl peptidase